MSIQNRKILIAPSLLAADYLHLADEIVHIDDAGADMIHFDVMDGSFVPNINFGLPLAKAVADASRLPVDAHLMIASPWKYAVKFAEAGAASVSIHIEAFAGGELRKLTALLDEIKAAGAKPAVVLSPDTPADAVFEVLPHVSMVLAMTVYPGFGGQKLILPVLDKISRLREFVDVNALECNIQADGGVNAETAPSVVAAGANVLVIGTALFKSRDMAAAVRQFKAM